ncbi:MAG TPA: hypothetical protein VHT73_08440 [Thermodesulfobacteriota bacterium]|nr:hypothetical protein [Thermodesulfobacteriota bacterium]
MKKEDKGHCGICEIPYFERNNYYYGKLMTVRDFFQEQCYFNEKRWLINRMISGWGVVCGLDVKPKEGETNKVIVTPGLAIDCCGREILVCEEKTVELIPEECDCCKKEKKKEEQGQEKKEMVICLEFYECKAEPINLPPIACDQKEKGEFNRIRDSYKIRVKPKSEVDLQDQCKEFCPLEHKDKTVQHYLCEELKEGCCECPEHPCLVLAEVTITQSEDPQNPYTIEIDKCSNRRLVYTNNLLYDLIHCYHGDLPHVTDINWKDGTTLNGAKIKWEDFNDGIYNDGVKVWFDRKMNEETINENTFLFLVKMEDEDTGNYRYDHVPGEVSYDYEESTGKSVATFKFTSEWIADVYLGYSRVREKGGEFKVVLKSDFIMSADENGKPVKALDGNFIGGRLPSGNGTQGGDFESWFFVEAKPEQAKEQKKGSRV